MSWSIIFAIIFFSFIVCPGVVFMINLKLNEEAKSK